MVFKALESALWWVPGTVWINDSYRPVSWVVAIAVGFGGVNFAVSKMQEIAQKISASKSET
jgi:hypothetical protein